MPGITHDIPLATNFFVDMCVPSGGTDLEVPYGIWLIIKAVWKMLHWPNPRTRYPLDTQTHTHTHTHTPNGMLKAIMRCSGENVVDPSELLDVSQSLELRCVYDFDQQRVEFNVSVYWVIKHLKEKSRDKTLLKAVCTVVPWFWNQRGVYHFALCFKGVENYFGSIRVCFSKP